MSRRVVVTGVGLLTPLGIGTELTWEPSLRPRAASPGLPQFDATAFSCRIAGEVKGFDPAQLHREKRNQEDGALHPVRHRGGGFRPEGFRTEGDAGDRRGSRRLHRQRNRRLRGDRARAPDAAGTRAAPHLAVFHSRHDHQSGVRATFRSRAAPRDRIRPPRRHAPPARIRSAIRSA